MALSRGYFLLFCCLFIVGPIGAFPSSTESNQTCIELGGCCRWLFWSQPCCGTTACQLITPFYGRCNKCTPRGKFCLRSSECCDGSCWYFRC
ncbi:hypothetical protein EG68_07739 [Paragonimus skrjabini miyazakii]|uniref:UPF0506 domain-containing protein n=1 Tax=Paragonimus skrjabini miyazakii TaxID=59628 RepID=A0A8S9YRD1_9TREM|nr:hypothetical protein EG68_07739 [Paragonimus skrjabini miyazakii]